MLPGAGKTFLNKLQNMVDKGKNGRYNSNYKIWEFKMKMKIQNENMQILAKGGVR